jgi:hypothetical protein
MNSISGLVLMTLLVDSFGLSGRSGRDDVLEGDDEDEGLIRLDT